MPFDFSYPNSSAEERGWGPGWAPGLTARPSSYPGTVVPLSVDLSAYDQGTVPFVGGVREEVHDLLEMLIEECAARGYRYTNPGCWGGGFRATKRSDGSFTTTPSNHSWYLAIDVSAPKNVYGDMVEPTHDIPDWMVDLFKEYGWRWLGDTSIHDWEHFDFAGTPPDAARMTAKARKDGLGMALTEEQQQTLDEAKIFLDELRSKLGSLDHKGEPASPIGAGDRVGRAVLKSEGASAKTGH